MPIGALGLTRGQFVPGKMEKGTAESAKGQKFQDVFTERKGRSAEPMSAAKNHLKYKNEYFNQAVDGVVVHNGVLFICDFRTDTLCLGDCSDRRNCIQVALENGGSVMVNRDNFDDLSKAITLFSPEDQSRIMAAIQRDKMAKHNQEEIKKELMGDIKEESKEDEN